MDTLDKDKLTTMLGLTTSKVKDIADALERNWTIQMICAGIGIALVYDVADLPKIMCKYFGQDLCTLRSAAPILLVVVLFYFMRFGQLLTAFLAARQLQDRLLSTYLGKSVEVSAFKPIHESTSFFEGYYSSTAFSSWAPLKPAYFLVSLLVVAVGQSAALFLFVRAYKATTASLVVAGLAVAGLIILYGGFRQANKNHPYTTKIVWTCSLLIVFDLVLFVLTAT